MGIQTLQVSWLVDHMLPKKLMYEGELFYLCTAPGCILQVRLWNLISMKPYVTTNLINLFHVTWRCMLLLLDHNFERTIDINIDTMVTEMAKLNHKIVEQASHKMAIQIHCFAHMLEFAVEDLLNDIYSNITTLLNDIYLHFSKSSKE